MKKTKKELVRKKLSKKQMLLLRGGTENDGEPITPTGD